MTADKRAVTLFISLALAVATVVAYLPTLDSGVEFLNVDDPDYVGDNPENPYVPAGITLEGLRWAFTADFSYNWHPLTWISLELDSNLWGHDEPRGFHLTNIAMHVANTLLLFATLRRTTGAIWRSAAVAGFFALHPAHAESVAWVAERKDVLSGLLWMLTTFAYVRYAERPSLGRYLLVPVLLAMGLMSKPMVVTLPATLLLLDYWPLRRWPGGAVGEPRFARASLGRLLLEKLPLFALVAATIPLTIKAQTGAIRTLEHLPMPLRIENAVVSYVEYIGMVFWPRGLAIFYPYPVDGIPRGKLVACAAILAAITLAAIILARRRPYLIVGWLWYLGTLVPVIGLMQVGMHALADRYTYVPYIGLGIMLAWGAADVLARWELGRRALAAITVAALAACLALTWRQAGFWHDSVTVWQRAVDVTRDNAVAHDYLGTALWQRGEYEAARQHLTETLRLDPRPTWTRAHLGTVLDALGRPDEAAAEFEAALRGRVTAPTLIEAHIGLGHVREAQGRYAEALEHYQTAARLDPNFVRVRVDLGRTLNRVGRPTDALAEFDAALAVQPDLPEAHNNRGLALEALGRLPEALAAYRKAVALDGHELAFRCNLAYALYESEQRDAAAAQYREVSRLKPDWPQLAMEEAWHKATARDAKLRNGPQALRLARQVCQATGFRQPQPLDVLAAACAEQGRFDDAVRFENQAINLLSSVGPPDALREARERLKLYESRKPYRQP